VTGAAWRIAAYAQHRSLWYDEAALALNIAGRGFVELVEPLDYLQTAPPLFLWIDSPEDSYASLGVSRARSSIPSASSGLLNERSIDAPRVT
jgi:hypothetical protein